MELQAQKKDVHASEGLFIKGKTKNRESKQQFEDKDKPRVKCNYCHKDGHLKKDCYSLKRKLQNQKNRKPKQAEASVGENTLTFSDALATSDQCNDQPNPLEKQDWVLDFGCSFHMTPSKGWFSTYKEWDEGLVYIG